MSRITILDPVLSNQIAAGEVIERPASVVKELVENSLDAGADDIQVEILEGGHRLIRVKDNGAGIHVDDLALSLMRHATSKITSYEDLNAVGTLGFRGEALASIASVSRLKISTKIASVENGFSIQNNLDGTLTPPSPIAHHQGTTIEIADIFYQTPARKKFLRTERTEFQYIETMLYQLALSRFDVGFKLKHNNRDVFSLPKADTLSLQEKRVQSVFGAEFMAHALHMDYSHGEMQLTGWIAEPRYSRAQRDQQMTYINDRFVKDKTVIQAVREAYRDVLFHGRHPAFLLYFSLHPENVDVNVHPTKQEVRFRDQQLVFSFIRRGVHEALHAVRPCVSQAAVAEPFEAHEVYAKNTPVFEAPRQNGAVIQQQIAAYQDLHQQSALALSETVSEGKDFPMGFAVGQIQDIYIIAQNKVGMIMVDMHAAHERILYEQLKKMRASFNMPTQKLLVPIVLNISKQEVQAFEKAKALFLETGFQLALLGETQLVLREMPAIIKHKNPIQLISDVLSDLVIKEKSSRINASLDAVLASIACHAAFRAPHKLNIAEMNALLRQMETTENSGCCNHGRPTWRLFAMSELDKFFYRGK